MIVRGAQVNPTDYLALFDAYRVSGASGVKDARGGEGAGANGPNAPDVRNGRANG
ncbi:hypothetical protein PSP6_950009 [Paraburkholderia tropica]|nr:hypothetical protein PSP6_950009 [Paraburkholderia tropica]